jgi:hypothetical protein
MSGRALPLGGDCHFADAGGQPCADAHAPRLTASYALRAAKMKKPNTAKPPHRPSFQFSAEQRAQAVRLRLAGCTLAQIAAGLGIAHKTLVKHMGTELEHATRDLLGHIAAKAYSLAKAGDPRMVEFVLRTRGGWASGDASPSIMSTSSAPPGRLRQRLR